MTLGRTSTGAIKIKTDTPGLRAVECGCCQGGCQSCPVTDITITSEFRLLRTRVLTGGTDGMGRNWWGASWVRNGWEYYVFIFCNGFNYDLSFKAYLPEEDWWEDFGTLQLSTDCPPYGEYWGDVPFGWTTISPA